MGVVWETPNAAARPGVKGEGRWQLALKELATRPGEWGLIDAAHRYRNLGGPRNAARRMKMVFEFTFRVNDDRTVRVYARYTGVDTGGGRIRENGPATVDSTSDESAVMREPTSRRP